MTELTLCLKRARQEVMLALGADSDEKERFHRAQAESLTAEAVRDIEREPNQAHDWSELAPAT